MTLTEGSQHEHVPSPEHGKEGQEIKTPSTEVAPQLERTSEKNRRREALKSLMKEVESAEADRKLDEFERSTKVDLDGDGFLPDGTAAKGGALDDLAGLGADVAVMSKELFGSLGFKKAKEKAEEAADGASNENRRTARRTERRERQENTPWPEPIEVKELEYKNSPFSTREGRPLWMSSKFGMRMHPTLHEMKHHGGIDLNVGQGREDLHEPLYATVEMEVVNVESSSKGGNTIRLRDPKTNEVYVFRHLDEKPPFEDGDTVKPGECFGKIGSTGRSTGPHLHLELELDGRAVDPLPKFKPALRLA